MVAVKQATTDLDQARAILDAGLVLYAGNDDLLAPFLELGGSGGICVASHLVGTDMLRICELAEAGDFEGAHELDRELSPVYEALSITTNPIPLKAALELLGLRAGAPRLPLVEATDEQCAVLRSALAARGLTAAA